MSHEAKLPAAAWQATVGIHDDLAMRDLNSEYRACKETSAVVDTPGLTLLELTDDDRNQYLSGMITNDMSDLKAGDGVYTCTLSNKGKLVAEFVVLMYSDRIVLVVGGGRGHVLLEHLERYVIADYVDLEVLAGGVLCLLGPESGDVLKAVSPSCELPELLWGHADAQIAGVDVTIVRSHRASTASYDLIISGEAQKGAKETVLAALTGQEGGAQAVGLSALNVLRVEAGLPWFGIDMNENSLPLEAGLRDTISTSKGCYIGQETIIRVLHQGHVNRNMVGLLPESENPPPVGSELFYEGKTAGTISSSVYSPEFARPIALATLRRSASDPGTVVGLSGGTSATVCELPFSA